MLPDKTVVLKYKMGNASDKLYTFTSGRLPGAQSQGYIIGKGQ